MRRREAVNVRKFWVSGMSPVAADLASAANAAPPSLPPAPPADGDEIELDDPFVELLAQPDTSRRTTISSTGDVLVCMARASHRRPEQLLNARWLFEDAHFGNVIHVRVAVADARYETSNSPSRLQVVIPARRRVWLLLFLSVWLAGWGAGEVDVAISIARGHLGASAVFTLAWLVGWTLAGAAVVLAIAWTAFGREVVTIAGGDLTVRQAVGPFGRTREYDLAHLRD